MKFKENQQRLSQNVANAKNNNVNFDLVDVRDVTMSLCEKLLGNCKN